MSVSLSVVLVMLCVLGCDTTSVGETITAATSKINNYSSTHELQLSSSRNAKYLFLNISVSPQLPTANLTILSSGKVIKKCHFDNYFSCFLSRDNYSQVNSVSLQIQCGEECEYSITSYYSNLQHLLPNSSLRIVFKDAQPRQLYYIDLKNTPFQLLRVVLRPQTRASPFERAKMYVMVGEQEPNEDQYDGKSVHMWEDSQGLTMSKDDVQEKGAMLLVVGLPRTIYTITCTITNKTHSEVTTLAPLNQYLSQKQTQMYHIQFVNGNKELQYEEYVMRLSMYSGTVEVQYFMDSEGKNIYTPTANTNAMMADFQMSFNRQTIVKQLPNGLYLRITAIATATLSIKLVGGKRNMIIALSEHVTQFLSVDSTQNTVAYLVYDRYIGEATDDPSITVSLILSAQISLEFRICKLAFNLCLEDVKGNSTAVVKESKLAKVGNKLIYQFNMVGDFFKKIGGVEERGEIFIVMRGIEKEKTSVTLDYYLNSQVTFMREGKPIQAIVYSDQPKYYKYHNEDQQVNLIRIHVNRISGSIQVGVMREENTTPVYSSQPIISIISQLSKPIIVVVSARQESIYSLTIQSIGHKIQSLSTITLTEGVQFDMELSPKKYQLFALHPFLDAIHFNYSATANINICTLSANNQCTGETHESNRKGMLKVEKVTPHSKTLIKVENPTNIMVKISLFYTSSISEECSARKVNIQYHDQISASKCISFQLPKKESLQLRIYPQQIVQPNYMFEVCGNVFPLEKNTNDRYEFKGADIKKACEDNIFTAIKMYLKDHNSVTVTYSLGYSDERILLLDGLAYEDSSQTTLQPLRIFTYELLNRINTTVFVRSESQVQFVVKIVEAGQQSNATIGENDYQLQANHKLFFVYFDPYLVVTPQQLTNCTKCVLVIAVLSMEENGTTVRFTIQVSQANKILTDGTASKGYLAKGSTAYYEFSCQKEGIMFLDVSDDQRNCVKMYVSDANVPSSANSLSKEIGNEMSVECQAKQLLYIGIQALKNCPYSVAATNSICKITRIERGSSTNIYLKPGEVRLFLIKHMSKKSFKLLSLHQYGLVQIYINQSSLEEVQSLTTSVNVSAFQIKGEYKNRLIMEQNNSIMCDGCYYIVAVEALKFTESSLYYGDDTTIIPFNHRVINDLLKNNQTVKGSFFSDRNIKLELKVHSGRLKTVFKRNKVSYTNIFESSEQLYEKQLQFQTQSENPFQSAPISIQFTGLTDLTTYSARITDDEEKKVSTMVLWPGVSKDILLSSSPECVSGIFRDLSEKILLMFNVDTPVQFLITGELANFSVPVVQQGIKNSITLQFDSQNNLVLDKAINYLFCIELKQTNITTLMAKVLQSQNFNLLAPNAQAIVSKEKFTFLLHTEAIVDLRVCKGKAFIVYSQTRQKLQTTVMKPLDTVGITEQTHVIRIKTLPTAFVQVSAEDIAAVKWLPLDQDKDIGMGYIKYKVSAVTYDASFNRIDIHWESLKQVLPTSNTILHLYFRVYVSSSESDLESALHCEIHNSLTTLPYQIISPTTALSEKMSLSLKVLYVLTQKSDLTTSYPLAINLYIGIVADLSIKLQNTTTQEDYRFIYPTQQMPASIFVANKIEELNTGALIALMVGSIITLLIFTYVCTQKIVPILSRLRSSVLIEEEQNQDKHSQHVEVPMSSDRHGVLVVEPGPLQTQNNIGES